MVAVLPQSNITIIILRRPMNLRPIQSIQRTYPFNVPARQPSPSRALSISLPPTAHSHYLALLFATVLVSSRSSHIIFVASLSLPSSSSSTWLYLAIAAAAAVSVTFSFLHFVVFTRFWIPCVFHCQIQIQSARWVSVKMNVCSLLRPNTSTARHILHMMCACASACAHLVYLLLFLYFLYYAAAAAVAGAGVVARKRCRINFNTEK